MVRMKAQGNKTERMFERECGGGMVHERENGIRVRRIVVDIGRRDKR